MAQQTMTEKDMYASAFDQEHQITLKILKAYPPAKIDLKPTEQSRSARDLGWMLVMTQMIVVPVLEQEELAPGGLPSAPKTWEEIVTAFETSHRETKHKIDRITDTDLTGAIRMPVGYKQVGEVRRGTALWMFLHDSIHHRGQFSVYLRLAGAKVPAIYGPSGDEPWV
jgi:uncharacterized damage-inducible protein DinB